MYDTTYVWLMFQRNEPEKIDNVFKKILYAGSSILFPPFSHIDLLFSKKVKGTKTDISFTLSRRVFEQKNKKKKKKPKLLENIQLGYRGDDRFYMEKNYTIYPLYCNLDCAKKMFKLIQNITKKYKDKPSKRIKGKMVVYDKIDIFSDEALYQCAGFYYLPCYRKPDFVTLYTNDKWFCSQMLCAILQECDILDKNINPSIVTSVHLLKLLLNSYEPKQTTESINNHGYTLPEKRTMERNVQLSTVLLDKMSDENKIWLQGHIDIIVNDAEDRKFYISN